MLTCTLTDLSDPVNVARHDTNLAGIGGNDTGAVGSDQAGLILGLHSADNLLIAWYESKE
jgi:hypothetical protein